MSYTKVKLDVICHKLAKQDPVYRLYLDGVLVVERKFWPEAPIYRIQEHLTLVDDDRQHSIKIENVYPHLGDVTMYEIQFVDGDDNEKIDVYSTFEPKCEEFVFKLRKR